MRQVSRKLGAPQIAEVETLAAVLSTEQIADYFGIGRRTFYSLMERDPEIAARYKKGRARAVGSIAQSLIAKARGGNVTAMIFFLKTQAGWRETLAVEQAPAPEAPLLDFSQLSTSTIRELAAAIRSDSKPAVDGRTISADRFSTDADVGHDDEFLLIGDSLQ